MKRIKAIVNFFIDVKRPIKELAKFEKVFKKDLDFSLNKECRRLIREAKEEQVDLNKRLFCEAFQRKHPGMFKKKPNKQTPS